ncbi:MAG TPA: hypothetical protein VMX74_01190 [Pirellulales bacterium]|nr:hypothetical protein [Pirellulales bacterium]
MPEEKRVKLTAEQMKDIKKAFHSSRIGHKLMTDLIVELTAKLAEAETELWDQVYELGGLTDNTHCAQIRYLTSEVVFTPRKELDA